MERGELIDGRYELVASIGEGGTASVWEARSIETGETVAIKVLRPSIREDGLAKIRLRREALAARELSRSPHVVDIVEVFDLPSGDPCVVMERLSGDDLRRVLLHEGRLAPARAAKIVMQLCDALAEAHGQGIIHHDLKPENIVLSHREDGREAVTLFDFGIANFRSSPDSLPADLDDEGSRPCTVHYAAPEQLVEGSSADHRSDIYSVGVILYELLTGRRPFRNKSSDEMTQDILTSTPPSLRTLRPELPESLDAIVMRAMARDPSDRYQGVDELSSALVPCLDMRETIEPPPPSGPRLDPPSPTPQLMEEPRHRGGRRVLHKVARACRRAFEPVIGTYAAA